MKFALDNLTSMVIQVVQSVRRYRQLWMPKWRYWWLLYKWRDTFINRKCWIIIIFRFTFIANITWNVKYDVIVEYLVEFDSLSASSISVTSSKSLCAITMHHYLTSTTRTIEIQHTQSQQNIGHKLHHLNLIFRVT